MNRKILATAIVLAAVTLVCAKSTKLVATCKLPNFQRQEIHRVLALGLSNRTEVRADFEDALSAQLTAAGFEAIPGNAILLRPPGTQLDLKTLREQVRANHIEAVVVSRLIKVDDTITYIPGVAYVVPYPYYNTFYGYYGTLYPVIYSPGYLDQVKKVRVETNLYYVISAPDGQLVWTGITDTLNPSNVHKAINGLVKLVVTQMQNEQVL